MWYVRDNVIYWYRGEYRLSNATTLFLIVFFVLGNAAPLLILAIVLAPLSSFCTDHTLVTSCLSSEGHLHHMQENLAFADSIPLVMAKY